MSDRPHKFPAAIPDGEIIAWCCAACKQWVSEYRRDDTECSVDWRHPVADAAPNVTT